MITTCTVCQTRYRLDAAKVPPRVIKVRCPGCQGVFSLDGAAHATGVPAPPEGFETSIAAPPPVTPKPAPPALEPVAVSPAAPVRSEQATPPPAPAAPAAAPAATSAPASTIGREPVPAVSDSSRKRRSKEEMLARALVSDILVYNRDLRDSALAEGNLLEALGAEIKKSWELYKEKVTPEVANSTNHFRDALNEILAEGEKVF